MSTLQVDKITPYLSASVTIEGSVIQANAATTGSNTFVGDQNIQGTLTASLQEGYAWVGGVGNVSITAATSSFGGSGAGFPFTGDAVITGSLLVSGSSTFDVTVQGRQLITGPNTGATTTPQLIVSSSDFNTLVGRNSVLVRESGKSLPGTFSRGALNLYAEPGNPATLTIANYDEGFVSDVNLYIEVDSGSGIVFQDWDNGSAFEYQTWMSIAPNLGNTPDVEFKRSIQVTGSVEISSVMQLAGQDPLPAGGVGQLAVSASNLYYHNGSNWSQIN